MSPKLCSKFNFSCKLFADFFKALSATCLIIVGAASVALSQEKVVSDPVNEVRWEKMKNVLTRVLENDQVTEEALRSLTAEIGNIRENETDTSALKTELQAASIKLKAAEKEIRSLQQRLADVDTVNSELRNLLSEMANEVSSLADAASLNTAYREELELFASYNVIEDEQGVAKLYELNMLSQLMVNFPVEAACSEIGPWFIEDYVGRVKNSFFVSNGIEIMICEYENSSYVVRKPRFNDRSHVINIDG